MDLSRRQPQPRKPCCPRCKHRGYTQGKATHDGRPKFTCDRCGQTWPNGLTGGKYAKPEK